MSKKMTMTNMYTCPVSGCVMMFQTVKFMMNHLVLYHNRPKNADSFTCYINNCMFKSTSVVGYRLHVRRSHSDDWSKNRYTRCHNSSQLQENVTVVEMEQESQDVDMLDDNVGLSEDVPTDSNYIYSQLQKKITLTVLKHREVSLIPKSTMEGIVNDVHDILRLTQSATIHSLSSYNGGMLGSVGDTVFENFVDQSESVLDEMFQNVTTAKQLKSYCTKNLGMVKPLEIMLGHHFQNGKKKKNSFQYVPVLETIKMFLAHQDVASEIVKDCTQVADNDYLYSYKDGSACQNSTLFRNDKSSLRLHFYVDDFEVCNPIGSRRSIHKLTAVYYIIGNVHTRYWSQNSSIHLAVLARTKVVKLYGLEKIMSCLIRDIKVLEREGVKLKFDGFDQVFKGSIATISADNLASHEIGGFRQTFSSGKICRFCLADYETIASVHTEENCVIRTAKVHSIHLDALSKDESCSRTYGVKSNCVFSELENFVVPDSLPPDVMHDILEGFCPINVKVVLKSLILSKKLTVKTFNSRLDMFEYPKCDDATKPPHIPADFISTGRLIGSASQNWCLFRNLPFLVHDCISDDDDIANFWQLHLLARKICQILFATVVKKEWLLDLQQYIAEHHALLSTVDKGVFTPKLHFLVHYPRLIELYGPLKHLWCMRFEACHQYYKKAAKISNNYKNIALTLAERHQFKACWLMSGENALSADTVVSGKQLTITVAALPKILQEQLDKSFSIKPMQMISSVTAVHLQCAELYVNELYVIQLTPVDEIPIFVRLSHIIEHDGTWIACGLLHIAQQYSNVTDSYQIQNCEEYVVLSPSELKTYGPVACVHVNGMVHAYLSYRIAC